MESLQRFRPTHPMQDMHAACMLLMRGTSSCCNTP